MSAKAHQDKSLYRVLGGIIVATVVLVLGAEAAYTYHTQRQHMIDDMKRQSELSIATLQKNLAGLMEAYAINEYDNLVATEIELRRHFAIVVTDYNMGKLLGRAAYVSGKIRDADGAVIDYAPDDTAQQQWLAKAFLRSDAPIALSDRTELGRVAVYASDAAMKTELEQILLRTLVDTIIILALLIALLLLGIRQLLVRPLARIAAVLQRHDGDGIPTDPIPHTDYREIAVLTDSMNNMVEVIKRSRETLKAERFRLSNVIEGTNAGTWEWNVQTGAVVFNERWAEIVGHTLEELAPMSIRTWSELTHPDDRRRSQQLLERHFAGHSPYYECEARMRHKDGRWVWVLDRGKVATWSADGKPLLMFGTHQEITERKQAEASLRRSMEESERLRRASLDMLADQRQAEKEIRRLSLAVEQSPESIIIANLDGTIEYVNDAFVRTTGYTRDEVRGLNPRILKSGKTPASTYDSLWRTLTRGAIWRGEFINHRKSGSEYIESAIVAPLRQPDGVITHYVAVKQDITEKRRMERELVRHRHHLEDLVESRTAELEQARTAAEAANRAKSVFLANMSHELRTPLNAILGFAQILERDPTIGPRQREELGTIARSGQHLLALINDVLEISRIEAGRVNVERQPFDLDGVLSAAEDMAQVRARDKGLTLRVERLGDLPRHVEGDAHHLRQVLINLLGNAVKYTDQGMVTLRIRPREGHIRFEVIDTGPGIPENEQSRIFEPFYQTELGIARGEGTGLGLGLSRQFVRLMGGELELESAPDQGSRFSFSLPLPPTKAPVGAAAKKIRDLEPGQPACHILIAEDNTDNRVLLRRILEEVGFDVSAAGDGGQAVAAFRERPSQLVLMDMRMPVMDGYQATRHIRQLPGGEAAKIIALTANAFREERSAMLAAGCDEMLAKPIERDDLLETIGSNLGLRYRYHPATDSAALSPADLTALPAEQREQLKRAAEGLDTETCRAFADALAGDYPTEARLIGELLDEFRFDRLLDFLEPQTPEQ